MMKSPIVTICSSSRFYETAKKLYVQLSDNKIETYTPRFDFDETVTQVDESQKANLTREFLDKIKRSSHIYVISHEGYTGRSVCIEVGYAFALNKGIILSEPATEFAIKALTSEVVPIGEFPGYIAKKSQNQ